MPYTGVHSLYLYYCVNTSRKFYQILQTCSTCPLGQGATTCGCAADSDRIPKPLERSRNVELRLANISTDRREDLTSKEREQRSYEDKAYESFYSHTIRSVSSCLSEMFNDRGLCDVFEPVT